MQGQGKFSFSICDVYEGECQKGKQHSRSKMTFAGGDSEVLSIRK